MIKVTPAALDQIAVARKDSQADELMLRLAVLAKADGSLHYKMGFDDQLDISDFRIDEEGANVVIDQASQPLATEMTLDFVELEGAMQFIFINPNDPNQQQISD